MGREIAKLASSRAHHLPLQPTVPAQPSYRTSVDSHNDSPHPLVLLLLVSSKVFKLDLVCPVLVRQPDRADLVVLLGMVVHRLVRLGQRPLEIDPCRSVHGQVEHIEQGETGLLVRLWTGPFGRGRHERDRGGGGPRRVRRGGRENEGRREKEEER